MNGGKIAIIGFGHMGQAILQGLVKGGINRDNLLTSNKSVDNSKVAREADIIFICVKPYIVKEVLEEIKSLVAGKILISVAACIGIDLLEKYLDSKKEKVVRIMPNIPVSEGVGVVGFVVNGNLTIIDKINLQKLISHLGFIVECKNDEMLDRLSLISGCGTGYVSYFMHNLQKVAESYGFSQKDAQNIVFNTFSGTIKHIYEEKTKFKDLVEAVATKGGITEEVIRNLENRKYYRNLKLSIDHGFMKIKNIKQDLKGGD